MSSQRRIGAVLGEFLKRNPNARDLAGELREVLVRAAAPSSVKGALALPKIGSIMAKRNSRAWWTNVHPASVWAPLCRMLLRLGLEDHERSSVKLLMFSIWMHPDEPLAAVHVWWRIFCTEPDSFLLGMFAEYESGLHVNAREGK